MLYHFDANSQAVEVHINKNFGEIFQVGITKDKYQIDPCYKGIPNCLI